MVKKYTNKYYFSVEGETEKWYLEWLRDRINELDESRYKVAIDCKVEKDPYRRAKKMTIASKTEIWHLSDYESNDEFHVQQFKQTIDNLKKASGIGKNIVYKFGYSNFTFDLWIILHMMNCNASYAHRKQYVTQINRAFGERFENMDEYKHEDNFKRCLSKMDLSNVIAAIGREKKIMQRNKENGYILHQYKGYQYYKENPSLTAWEAIEKILNECKLL